MDRVYLVVFVRSTYIAHRISITTRTSHATLEALTRMKNDLPIVSPSRSPERPLMPDRHCIGRLRVSRDLSCGRARVVLEDVSESMQARVRIGERKDGEEGNVTSRVRHRQR
jgi:hypothetical protein